MALNGCVTMDYVSPSGCRSCNLIVSLFGSFLVNCCMDCGIGLLVCSWVLIFGQVCGRWMMCVIDDLHLLSLLQAFVFHSCCL